MFSALWHYRQKWRFNGFLYQWLSSLLHSEAGAEAILLLLVLSVLAAYSLLQKESLGTMLLDGRHYSALQSQFVSLVCGLDCAFPLLLPQSRLAPAYLNDCPLLLCSDRLVDRSEYGIRIKTLLALEFLPFYGMMLWSFVGKLHSKRV